MIEAKPDIVAVIEGAGVALRRRGNDFWCCCPFHEERTPSFAVSPERQRFKCFGCGESGDVIAFTMKYRGVGFKDALSALGIRRGRRPKPDRATEARRARIATFNAWVRDRYQSLCLESIELHDLQMAVKKRLPQDERIVWIYAEAMSRLPGIEHELDMLFTGNKDEIFQYFINDQGNDR